MTANLRFAWDKAKNRANQRKHGVSFEEAVHVFHDPLQVSIQDRIEGGEQRWQTFGLVSGVVLLMVAHAVHEDDENGHAIEVIRIISARRADRMERHRYEEQNR